jgi:hypothetical protein
MMTLPLGVRFSGAMLMSTRYRQPSGSGGTTPWASLALV